jgi:hypothetical protein
MGLLMVICGTLASLVALSGFLIPVVRNVESILPDQAGGSEPITIPESYPGIEVEL